MSNSFPKKCMSFQGDSSVARIAAERGKLPHADELVRREPSPAGRPSAGKRATRRPRCEVAWWSSPGARRGRGSTGILLQTICRRKTVLGGGADESTDRPPAIRLGDRPRPEENGSPPLAYLPPRTAVDPRLDY